MMMTGKTLLITGVLMDSSIAFHVARLAQEQGATVILSSFGRAARVTTAVAKRLPKPAPVIELDVTNAADLAALESRVREHTDHLDGVLHSVGFMPQGGFDLLTAQPEDVMTGFHVSAFSLKALTVAALPLMTPGSGVVGLTFGPGQAWPVYAWMGVVKGAFDATCRYLARELGPQGIRCNLVSAGPLKTTAATSIPGFEQLANWGDRAPLGWDVGDPVPAAKACVALMSDWFPATTGEIVHVDGGFHAVGA